MPGRGARGAERSAMASPPPPPPPGPLPPLHRLSDRLPFLRDDDDVLAILREAVANNEVEFVKRLLDGGVKLDGLRVFELFEGGVSDERMLKVLLDHGLDVGERDADGSTLIHWWCSWWGGDRTAGVFQQMLQAAPPGTIDAQDARGETALMYAARRGKNRKVRALIDAGANVHLRDRDGKAAWDRADKNMQYRFPELRPRPPRQILPMPNRAARLARVRRQDPQSPP